MNVFGAVKMIGIWSKPAVLFCALLSVASNSHAEAAVIEPVEVVWKQQQIEFMYSSSSMNYSCTGITSKVSAILKSVGARARKVWSANCSSPVSSMHLVKIQVETPFEATPELLTQMTSYDSRQELVAKVRGETLQTAADVERFSALWQPVSLSLNFQSGDCELVQALSREVLPKLSVRVVSGNQYCPSSGYSSRPRLKVEALLPIAKDSPLAERL